MQLAQDASGPLAALEAMHMAHITFVVGHPGVRRILFSELQRAEDTAAKRMVQTVLREYGKCLQALIKTGQTCGKSIQMLTRPQPPACSSAASKAW